MATMSHYIEEERKLQEEADNARKKLVENQGQQTGPSKGVTPIPVPGMPFKGT